MEIVEISKANALKAYKNTDAKGKALLTDLIKDVDFAGKITDRILTVEDAFDEVGEDYTAFLKKCAKNEDTIDEIAYKELKVVARALNQGWTPDYSNENQYKYYPWFRYNTKKAGFAFAGTYYGWSDTLAGAGSRLCFETEGLAKFAGETFTEKYNQYLLK